MATYLSDILLGADGDLLITSGDWTAGLSDNQNIEQIVDSNKGEWLFQPTCGVGIVRFLNGNISYAQIETLIQQQLLLDGFNVIDFNINQDELATQLILTSDLILNISATRP